MTHKDRDRLVVLKKEQKRLVRQREAAEELQQTERHTRRRRGEAVHLWRDRKHSRGDRVQGDTSEHDWREGRGPKFYLIHMIDGRPLLRGGFFSGLCCPGPWLP